MKKQVLFLMMVVVFCVGALHGAQNTQAMRQRMFKEVVLNSDGTWRV